MAAGTASHTFCWRVCDMMELVCAVQNALVTFKAGIMTDRPVPNSRKVRVTADKRKGEARLVKVRCAVSPPMLGIVVVWWWC